MLLERERVAAVIALPDGRRRIYDGHTVADQLGRDVSRLWALRVKLNGCRDLTLKSGGNRIIEDLQAEASWILTASSFW